MKLKNSIEGIISSITEEEEWTSDQEDKIVETTNTDQNKEKRMKRIEDSLRDFWDKIKCTNIRTIWSQKKKRKRKGLRKYLKRL